MPVSLSKPVYFLFIYFLHDPHCSTQAARARTTPREVREFRRAAASREFPPLELRTSLTLSNTHSECEIARYAVYVCTPQLVVYPTPRAGDAMPHLRTQGKLDERCASDHNCSRSPRGRQACRLLSEPARCIFSRPSSLLPIPHPRSRTNTNGAFYIHFMFMCCQSEGMVGHLFALLSLLRQTSSTDCV